MSPTVLNESSGPTCGGRATRSAAPCTRSAAPCTPWPADATDVLTVLTYLAKEPPERHVEGRLDLIHLAEEVAGQPEAEGGAVAHVVHLDVFVLLGEHLITQARRAHPLEAHEGRREACNRARGMGPAHHSPLTAHQLPLSTDSWPPDHLPRVTSPRTV